MSMRVRSHALWPALAGATALLGGCNDLGHYSTGPGESYCGSITLGSKFRQGMSPLVQMRLDLDASTIDVENATGGHISTFEAIAPTPNRVFSSAPLRPIPPLYHDTLSQLDFGDGNVKNALYAVSPADPNAEAMLAVISLRSDDSVDVRLIRPGLSEGSPDVPEGRQPVYGLFPLTKQPGMCGF